jgi:pimeloyl-ACP methyl ester carboxylesterase
MSWSFKLLMNLTIVCLFASNALSDDRLFSSSILWETNERSGLGQSPAPDVLEKIISVPLNPENEKDGYFDLYYYVEKAPNTGAVSSTRRKTVLFCAGGPGELAWLEGSKISSFLQKNEYDVVYFDLRGVGLSQIPPSNQYDRFLRSSFAIRDIEEIRRDLLGKDNDGKDRKWDAIIGYSYGTVLAQQYANQYRNNVEKLILVAPLSRHRFRDSTDAYHKFSEDFQRIHRESLEKIYTLEELGLDAGDKTNIVEALFGGANQRGIYERTEDEFGSLQFVIDNYCRLKNELKESNLEYSRNFFQELRKLRFVGWSTSRRQEQLEIASALKREVLDRQKFKDTCSDRHAQRSHRVFDVIGTYDGINVRFLREWLAEGKQNFRRALRKSAGEAHVQSQGSINTHIEKIGIIDGPIQIEPWDPATYNHSVPTLILKGGADPVTADHQAEYTYSKALSGTRTLIESPASGHDLVFPEFDDSAIEALLKDGKAILSGTLQLNPVEIPAGEKRLVSGKIRGRKLNDKLRISLPETEQGLKVVGLGVFLAGTDKRKDNVFVQIENTGDHDVHATTKIWTIYTDMFAGLVSFSLPEIPKGQVALAMGTLVAGERRKERQVSLVAPNKVDPELRVLCFKIEDKQANILFENGSDKDGLFNGKPKRWAVSVDSSETTFTVDPPPLLKGQAVPWSFDVPDVEFDLGYQYQIEPSSEGEPGLQGVCVPDHTGGNAGSIRNEVSIFLWNRNEDLDVEVKKEDGEWKITNNFFTLHAKVAPITIPPRAAKEGKARIMGFEWNKWIDFKATQGLEVAGFNILSEDEVSVLIWNKGEITINAADRDWTYVLLDEKGLLQRACDGSYKAPDYVRDCLIYSFLVTRPTEFDKAEIFDVIASHAKVSDPTHPQQLLKITKRHCLDGDCNIP